MSMTLDKIFQYLPSPSQGQAEQDYFKNQWAIITATFVKLLVEKKPAPIAFVRTAVARLLDRNQRVFIYEKLALFFYSLFQEWIFQASQTENILQTLCNQYVSISPHFELIFQIFDREISSRYRSETETVRQRVYSILCKQIISSNILQRIVAEFFTLVEEYRNASQDVEVGDMETRIALIKELGIFSCCELEYLERSKEHFCKLAEKIEKNEHIFRIINGALQREETLQRILVTPEDTVLYLEKQLIEEYYPCMIEYFDFLLFQDREDVLKILWDYTIRVGEKAMQMLVTRVVDVLRDCNRLIDEGNAIAVLRFRNKVKTAIVTSFRSNKQLLNHMQQTVEAVLLQKQKQFSKGVCRQMLCIESQHTLQELIDLFKMIPEKQQFMREFQVRLFRWLICAQPDSLAMQEQLAAHFKRECGVNFTRKLDRMLYDVWRQGKLSFYYDTQRLFKCRMLSNECPVTISQETFLPDCLLELRNKFQEDFRQIQQNNLKKIKWLSQFGTIVLSINGIESLFSQMEASIVIILSRAFRPMNNQQFAGIFEREVEEMKIILNRLCEHQIVVCEDGKSYELNTNNKTAYTYLMDLGQEVKEMKDSNKKDDIIIVEAAIMRILKKQKTMQRTDLTKLIGQAVKIFRPTHVQINQAFQKLLARDFIDIDRYKGIIRYRQ